MKRSKLKKFVTIWIAAAWGLTITAQNDTLIMGGQRQNMFINRVESSRAYQLTCVGVPLVVGGLMVKSEDDHFRQLRNDYLPVFDRHLDDYLQYLPAAVMLVLKASGVKGRSAWGRVLVSDAFSVVIMAAVVGQLKALTHVTRPDGSNNRSFPSGHTATAFMAATMLSKEYGGRSPWYSFGAYTVAAATGFMRMANNKHWLSDVLAGAGFGILSAELGYYLADLIFKGKGIHDSALQSEAYRLSKPSFLQLYLGLNVFPGTYKLKDGGLFRFSSGSTVGVEGAYFLNPYIGAGGKAGISSASVLRNNEASSLSFDFQSLYVGIYLSYQLLSRLQIGSKLLAGYVRTSPLYLSGSSITKRNAAGLATGCSLKFKAKSGFGMGLFADYEILPSFLRGGNRHVGHLLTLGGSVGLTF